MKKVLVLLLCIISSSQIHSKEVGIYQGRGLSQEEALKNAMSEALVSNYTSFISSYTIIANDEITGKKQKAASNPEAYISQVKIISISRDGNEWVVNSEITTQKPSFGAQYVKMYTKTAEAFGKAIVGTEDVIKEFRKIKIGDLYAGLIIKEKEILESLSALICSEKELELHEMLIKQAEPFQDDLFDFDVDVSKDKRNKEAIVVVSIKKNRNTRNLTGLVNSTLYYSSLSFWSDYGGYEFKISDVGLPYRFYNNDVEKMERCLSTIVTAGIFSFKIVDNIGNEVFVEVTKNGKIVFHGESAKCNDGGTPFIPLIERLRNTHILDNNIKVPEVSQSGFIKMKSSPAGKLIFTIKYSNADFENLSDIDVVPMKQNCYNLY